MVLDEIVHSQKRGEARGITSICSAHPWVLQAAIQRAAQPASPLLIEATCNQVNQFGGYTGMQPEDFVRYVRGIAAENDFPVEKILFGGDHLGPSVWQDEPAETAMQKAEALVRAYVRAGFVKIHLDASMKLGDDPAGMLPVAVSSMRAARLAKAAEAAAEAAWVEGLPMPRYVIGTEVPVPGGAKEWGGSVTVTTAESVQETLEHTRTAFRQQGLEGAWERVRAVVVQPGVEFGDDFVLDYEAGKAQELARFIETTELVYEAHSTDYQTSDALSALVRDHFAILKVGPALTFAFREAVFALTMIEEAWLPSSDWSHLREVLDAEMVRCPEHWRKYYHGTPEEQAFKRKFSFSDRVRYYWGKEVVQTALNRLFRNLNAHPIPLSLVSQFLPVQYARIQAGLLRGQATEMVLDKISSVLQTYP